MIASYRQRDIVLIGLPKFDREIETGSTVAGKSLKAIGAQPAAEDKMLWRRLIVR